MNEKRSTNPRSAGDNTGEKHYITWELAKEQIYQTVHPVVKTWQTSFGQHLLQKTENKRFPNEASCTDNFQQE